MPFEITQIDDKPIFVLTFTEPLDYENNYAQVTEALLHRVGDLPGPIYRISDYTRLNPEYKDIIIGLNSVLKYRRGGLSDDRFHPMIVFNDSFLSTAIHTLRPHFKNLHHIQLYSSLDEAVAYARQQLAS